jgi:uncharacterized protein YidB (DUF937 family)
VAAAAGLLAAAIGIGVVMAQSGEDGTGIEFLDRVAEKLGIDRSTLDEAIRDARSDELDEAVANGDLTQEQADRLRERLDEIPGDAPFIAPGFHGKFRGGEFGFAFKFGFGGHGIGFDSEGLAEFLAIEPEQLRDELQADGATLASVAEAHGKSRDELKAFMLGDLQEKLDARAAEGDLTQERADEILAEANDRVDELIDGEFDKPPFPAFKHEFGFPVPFGVPGAGFVGDDLAEFLGIDEEQLLDELREDGATLATVAEAHGKSRDELKTFLSDSFKAHLDELVADGVLTQARADGILSDFDEHVDDLIDGGLPEFGPLRGPFDFKERFFEDELKDGDSGSQEGELTPASRS